MGPFVTEALWGKPLWMWVGFGAIILALLAFDLGVLHRKSRVIGVRESLLLSAFYIALGVAFGGFVWVQLGPQAGIEYLTGFVIEKSLAMDNVFVIAMIFTYFAIPEKYEKSLAMDNVFVIAMIFTYFAIPEKYQHRVLFTGILGVIVLRAIMIGLGATLVTHFDWVLYLFAVMLIVTGLKMMWWASREPDLSRNLVLKLFQRRFHVTDRFFGERFLVRLPDGRTGRPALHLTPLFLALILIEVTDVIFAVDSIPAIFAITTDPYVVYTSNIFAILGLRALYFALAAVLHRFAYLNRALAVLLIFIGAKIFLADLFGWAKFPAEWSLGITFAILGAGILYSLWQTRHSGVATGRAGDGT